MSPGARTDTSILTKATYRGSIDDFLDHKRRSHSSRHILPIEHVAILGGTTTCRHGRANHSFKWRRPQEILSQIWPRSFSVCRQKSVKQNLSFNIAEYYFKWPHSYETLLVDIWYPSEMQIRSRPYGKEQTYMDVPQEDSSVLGCYVFNGKQQPKFRRSAFHPSSGSSSFFDCLTLKKRTLRFSKMPAKMFASTRCNISEDTNLHQHHT